MSNARRFILGMGIGFAVFAAVMVFMADQPLWFKQPIYMSTLYMTITLIIAAVVSELVAYSVRSLLAEIFLLALAVAAAIVPALYVNAAAATTPKHAEETTWYLLPLFVMMYQVISVVIMGLACSVVYGVITLVQMVRER